jgi:hypothetical protein
VAHPVAANSSLPREPADRPRQAAEASTATTVSEQVSELDTALDGLLSQLKALIDNRSQWADGIEGCRAGVTLLTSTKFRLKLIIEGARKIEAEMASARAEIDRYNQMHADLSAVERDLRAECERYRKMHADVSRVECELRDDMEKQQVTLEKQAVSLANVRKLAEEMVREINS